MKTPLLSLLILWMIALSATAKPVAYEGEKVLTHTFALNKNSQTLLRISHQYGLLKINQWDKNKIYCETTVRVKAESNTDVKKLLDKVNVSYITADNICDVETEFNSNEGNSDSRWISIEMQIFMPASMQMSLKNQYGDIYAGSTGQSFACDIQYGNLIAENITGENNRVKVAYGNATFAESSNLDLSVKYGAVNANKITFMQLNSAYSNIDIKQAGRINGNIKYGNCKIGQLEEGSFDAAYTYLTLWNISSQLNLNIRYGSCQIQVSNPHFSQILINASYTPVEVTLPENASFETDLNVKYGAIHLPNSAAYSQLTRAQDRVFGKVGSPANSRVNISNRYSHISILK